MGKYASVGIVMLWICVVHGCPKTCKGRTCEDWFTKDGYTCIQLELVRINTNHLSASIWYEFIFWCVFLAPPGIWLWLQGLRWLHKATLSIHLLRENLWCDLTKISHNVRAWCMSCCCWKIYIYLFIMIVYCWTSKFLLQSVCLVSFCFGGASLKIFALSALCCADVKS